eukprot:Gb_14277 [translate_table: standard]
MLRYNNLYCIEGSRYFSSIFSGHHSWFTTTHNWLIKPTIKCNSIFCMWNQFTCNRIVKDCKWLPGCRWKPIFSFPIHS